jgi:hypothetical protein
MRSECAILFCHQSPVWLYHIFPYYLIKQRDFWKNVIEHKMCFDFLCNFFSETFLILTRTKRDIIINVHSSWRKVLVILEIFYCTLHCSRQVFAEYSNIKFHVNPSIESRVVPRGLNSANMPKNGCPRRSICVVHYRSHMDWPGIQPGPLRWDSDD